MLRKNKKIVANWKMNPSTLAEAEDFYHSSCDACLAVGGHEKVDVVVCPPFIYLDALSKIESSTELGAQDCHWRDHGAFTGEVSPLMLKRFSVKYVIIGHSERRYIMRETDEMINKKVKAVLKNDLVPILAVGEKEKGDYKQDILIDQLSSDLKDLNAGQIAKIIIAYEPVWAIGTGDADTPENTLEAIKIIREILSRLASKEMTIPILYGGSVSSMNVADFLSHSEIAGALIGSASVDKEEFSKIIKIASEL